VTPRWYHDCVSCIFIGQDDERDYYYCPPDTLLVRWSRYDYAYAEELDEAPEFWDNSDVPLDSPSWYPKARVFARDAGVYPSVLEILAEALKEQQQ
jgi:hypothetical protein